jgi:DNA polymerase-3 subunit delta'
LSEIPEPDRLDNFDHPRQTSTLFGHEEAEAALIDGLRSGAMHHAWLFTGPKGIGKATLAYRLARFLLTHVDDIPEESRDLSVDPENPIFRRVAAGGHGDLKILRRPYDEKTKKLKRDITIEEVRRLQPFFGKAASEGGWRIAIVDCADDMNINAANALLKTLEEPPDRSLLILVCHQPGTQLATIRSRCRTLALKALPNELVAEAMQFQMKHAEQVPLNDDEAQAIAHLSGGSIGHGLELAGGGGLDLYQGLVSVLVAMPKPDVDITHGFASLMSGKKGEKNWELFGELITGFLVRLARGSVTGDFGATIFEHEREALGVLSHLAAPSDWIDCWGRVSELLERTNAVNLDRRQITLSIFFEIQNCARKAA